jgi:hypothetical protein
MNKTSRLTPKKNAAKAGSANEMTVNVIKNQLSIDCHIVHDSRSANEPNRTNNIPYSRFEKGFSRLFGTDIIIYRLPTVKRS